MTENVHYISVFVVLVVVVVVVVVFLLFFLPRTTNFFLKIFEMQYFISPTWNQVIPFCLIESHETTSRNGVLLVYHICLPEFINLSTHDHSQLKPRSIVGIRFKFIYGNFRKGKRCKYIIYNLSSGR